MQRVTLPAPPIRHPRSLYPSSPLPFSSSPRKRGSMDHHSMDSRSVPGMTDCVLDSRFRGNDGFCADLPFPFIATPAPYIRHPRTPLFVIPAEAGIHGVRIIFWIPAFAGMTAGVLGMTHCPMDSRSVPGLTDCVLDSRFRGNDSTGKWE